MPHDAPTKATLLAASERVPAIPPVAKGASPCSGQPTRCTHAQRYRRVGGKTARRWSRSLALVISSRTIVKVTSWSARKTHLPPPQPHESDAAKTKAMRNVSANFVRHVGSSASFTWFTTKCTVSVGSRPKNMFTGSPAAKVVFFSAVGLSQGRKTISTAGASPSVFGAARWDDGQQVSCTSNNEKAHAWSFTRVARPLSARWASARPWTSKGNPSSHMVRTSTPRKSRTDEASRVVTDAGDILLHGVASCGISAKHDERSDKIETRLE